MNFFIVIFCVIAGAYGEGQSPSTKNYSCPGVPPMQNLEVPWLNSTFYGCEESGTNFPDLSCTSLILVPNGPNGWSSIFSGFSKEIPKLWLLAQDHKLCSSYKERLETLKQQWGLNITTNSVDQNNCY
ncbi:hypothetical protein KQX54_008564 [Cotesia glomerata]|uniref:Uncharacterized protein n=1 Tax=Cotesia glomerata TaxID=32391 RepID=A0AAV7J5K3_COTGL|nr:hypothetical protein KQX54_008564 [Cotesia glomerata]